ncbi:hypothetical protein O6H91_05G008900 [Diphasiastrum complanatum]|uniref:Uncharacterized protein n=1 Tax=Diphasiastrum complanatum TaxID=34168 RepID=A0ACC2DKM6_DIPCM|nr:hypothetical protein O6H91_05G008900 [Diphasiastrum complanatum]
MMYRRPSLVDYEAALPSTRFILPPLNLMQPSELGIQSGVLTDYRGLSSSLIRPSVSTISSEQPWYRPSQDQLNISSDIGWRTARQLVASYGRTAAPSRPLTEGILQASRYEEYVSGCNIYGSIASQEYLETQRNSGGSHGIEHSSLNAYGSAFDDTDSLSSYRARGNVPLLSTLYQSDSNLRSRSNEQFPVMEMRGERMICQERLINNARRAEKEAGIQDTHGNVISLGELQRKPSLSVYGEQGIIQPDLVLSQRPLISRETEVDRYGFNRLTGFVNRSNHLQGFPSSSEDARSYYRQSSSSDLYHARSSLVPEYPCNQRELFANQTSGKLPKRMRSPAAFSEGKRVKREERGISHAEELLLMHNEQRNKLPTVNKTTNIAPYKKHFMTDSQKCRLTGCSESKTDDAGLKQGWNCDPDVKSSPTWSNLEIGKTLVSELVTKKNKELDIIQDVQMVACVASRKFFQSLQDDESSDESASDLEDLDDDMGYPFTKDLQTKADNLKNREQQAYKFFAKLFEDDLGIRKFYEENRNHGAFDCLVCFGSGTGTRRRYPDLVSLVQHAKTIIKTKKRFEHRGYCRAVSDLLGWLSSESHSISLAPRGCIPPLEQTTTTKAGSPLKVCR